MQIAGRKMSSPAKGASAIGIKETTAAVSKACEKFPDSGDAAALQLVCSKYLAMLADSETRTSQPSLALLEADSAALIQFANAPVCVRRQCLILSCCQLANQMKQLQEQLWRSVQHVLFEVRLPEWVAKAKAQILPASLLAANIGPADALVSTINDAEGRLCWAQEIGPLVWLCSGVFCVRYLLCRRHKPQSANYTAVCSNGFPKCRAFQV